MKSGLRLLVVGGLGLGFLFAGAGTAQAIIIADAGGGAPLNNTAPADDPGWDHVGSFSNGTGVYLGNGWVITAAHVTTSGATFTLNGNSYTYVAGSGHILENPSGLGLSAQTDLWMGQYVPAGASPALPSGVLTISSATPTAGTLGIMIGWGKTQTSQTETRFYVDTTPSPWQWSTTNSLDADSYADGFYWGSTRQQRWAQSPVATLNGTILNDFTVSGGRDVRGFATKFVDQLNGGNVADNDSGSPLFIKTDAGWELAGIAHLLITYSGQNLSGAPQSTVVYGNSSFYSDLSFYADQINALVAVPEPSSLTLLAIGAAGLLVCRRRTV